MSLGSSSNSSVHAGLTGVWAFTERGGKHPHLRRSCCGQFLQTSCVPCKAFPNANAHTTGSPCRYPGMSLSTEALIISPSHLCPPRPLPPLPHYHLPSPQPAAKAAGKPGSVGVVTRMPRTHCPAVTTLRQHPPPSCSLAGHPRAQSCD